MYKRKRAGNTITRKINSTKDTAAKADKNHYISNSYLEGFIPIDTEYFTASKFLPFLPPSETSDSGRCRVSLTHVWLQTRRLIPDPFCSPVPFRFSSHFEHKSFKLLQHPAPAAFSRLIPLPSSAYPPHLPSLPSKLPLN